VLSKEPRATEKQQQQQQMRRSTAPRSLPGDLQADAMQVLETQEQRSVRMAAEGQKQRQREKQKESNQRGAKRLAIKREQNAQLQLAQDMNDRQLQIEELREVLDNGKFDLLLHQDGMPVRKEDLTEAGLRQFYKQCSSVNSYYVQADTVMQEAELGFKIVAADKDRQMEIARLAGLGANAGYHSTVGARVGASAPTSRSHLCCRWSWSLGARLDPRR
jgi:hypothetical protein